MHALESKALANKLFDEVRVICWVMTTPEARQEKGSRVLSTWGHRCNELLLFMSSNNTADAEKYNNTIILPPVTNDGNKLWSQTKYVINYLYANRLQAADWFLKVDDDTYVIMENLRHMLYPYDASYSLSFSTDFKYHDVDKSVVGFAF